jgi:integrase
MATKPTRKPKQSWPPIVKRKYPSGQVGYQIAVMIQGKRIRETFKTGEAAQTRAEQLRAAHANEGAAAFNLSADVRHEAAKAAEKLMPFKATITEAVDYYVDHVLAFRNTPAVNAIIAEIVETKRTNGRREKTILSFRTRCERFAKNFGERLLSSITPDEIRAWLTDETIHGTALGAVSRVNYLVAIGNLFSYGLKRGYCDRNPAKLVDRPSRESGEVEFLTVEQIISLLLHAKGYELVPYVALGVFAGLRPEKELRALDWPKINLGERTIRIDATLAKTRQRRVVEIGEALASYLVPYTKRRGPVVDMNTQEFRKRWESCRREAGVTPWRHDVMRHSYATYHLAAFNDIGKLSLQMGNSPQVIHSAYKGLVSKADAERFWNLRPAADAAGKIVPMKAAGHK